MMLLKSTGNSSPLDLSKMYWTILAKCIFLSQIPYVMFISCYSFSSSNGLPILVWFHSASKRCNSDAWTPYLWRLPLLQDRENTCLHPERKELLWNGTCLPAKKWPQFIKFDLRTRTRRTREKLHQTKMFKGIQMKFFRWRWVETRDYWQVLGDRRVCV